MRPDRAFVSLPTAHRSRHQRSRQPFPIGQHSLEDKPTAVHSSQHGHPPRLRADSLTLPDRNRH